jgi:hypothetical protein
MEIAGAVVKYFITLISLASLGEVLLFGIKWMMTPRYIVIPE